MGFDVVWSRIVNNAGKTFTTVSGIDFTYRVEGDGIVPDRTNYRISRRDFETAWNLPSLTGPGQINNIVRGPAYVYAIITDPRI